MTIPNQVKTFPSQLAGSFASGPITANGGSVQLEIDGAPSVVVQTSGTWQLDLIVQTSMDATNWSNPLYLWEMDSFPLYRGHIQLGMNAISGAQSRNGQYRVKTDGAKYVRVFAQAAGGTPGSASVTITASPIEIAPPIHGMMVMIFDQVDATAQRVSPVFPHPGMGWRADFSTFISANLTGMTGNELGPEFADDYAFANFQAQGNSLGASFPNSIAAGYYAGESISNAGPLFLGSYMRWRWTCTVYPSAAQKVTFWATLMAPLTAGPMMYAPGVADQTSLNRGYGALSQGPNTWIGAQVLGTDAAANANGGKLRPARMDGQQALITSISAPVIGQAASIAKRKARNVNATVQAISTFANGLLYVVITNASAATAFVNFYDLATGGVTVGTTVPDMEFAIAAGASQFFSFSDYGIWFSTAISVASVTTDNGAAGSGAGVHVHCGTTS